MARNGWEPNWGRLYLLVQLQINVPLIRDLLTELRPGARDEDVPQPSRGAGARAFLVSLRSPAGMLPRRWPETLAASAVLLLTGLLASGWVNPMLPWSS
ncbi:cellulose synthase (UDP-forming) OS=Streptomyces cyaneofuscatus OX=66883 GN=G3I52_07285 PE=4 SV=1 [Streptomyces cyaneofuscatus]